MRNLLTHMFAFEAMSMPRVDRAFWTGVLLPSRNHSAIYPHHSCAIICRMKILSSSVELEQGHQRAVRKGRRIVGGVYLIVAAGLFVLWFVAGSIMLSYLFGGWMMTGAIVLWLIEITVEY
jgi:hypothetical protein